MAALWPTTCLVVAYWCMNEELDRMKAITLADDIPSTQDEYGGLHNFQDPDGSFERLQNYPASMAFWLFYGVDSRGRIWLFAQQKPA